MSHHVEGETVLADIQLTEWRVKQLQEELQLLQEKQKECLQMR
jgi:hypothetical protein